MVTFMSVFFFGLHQIASLGNADITLVLASQITVILQKAYILWSTYYE